jgi:hypothetical protein
MPYQPNIPLSTDNLNVSQGDIQGNFITANTVMGQNHYPFDDATIGGKHKFVDMPILAAVPSIAAGDGGLYTKTTSGRSNLFYTSDAAGNEIQITTSVNPSIIANGGFTFLPGGLIMIWGSFNPNVSTTVTFPNIAFTGYGGNGFPTACFQVQLTGAAANNSTFRNGISTGTITQTGFVWEGTISANWNPIYYLAIGN